MPFCNQCGNQVGPADAFCGRCGSRQPTQPGAPPGSTGSDPLASITPKTASILCYVPGIGWIASIVVLASNRFRRNRAVRFHAFQGLYLFVAWLMNSWVLRPIGWLTPHLHFYHIVQAILLAMSIFMMVKASHE